MRDRFDALFLLSPTTETQEEYAPFSLRCFHFKEINADVAKRVSDVGRELIEMGKPRNLLLVIDDCAYDKKLTKDEKFIREIFNGRHHNVTIFYSAQYLNFVPPFFRENADYIFVGKDLSRKNKQKLYDEFFSMFDSVKDFSYVMTECTKNYGFIVCDRLIQGTAINDSVKMYRGRPKLPPFRIGHKIFWELEQKYHIKNSKTFLAEQEKKKQEEKQLHRTGVVPIGASTRITSVRIVNPDEG